MTEYLITENNDFIVSSANENFITEESEYLSYGVKYQLSFSDVLGNGKQIQILKKNYSGDVLPIIGTGNPLTITWNAKEDFYSPIIGSSCTLNFMVTDSVQYDDFYKFDEREYKVVVNYAKSKIDSFVDRVEIDGGIVESSECISNAISNFETISTTYRQRVIDDGGIVESLSCVQNEITDSNVYNFETYWTGFLVVDRFKEKLRSFPFPVSFKAFDGLGTLKKYDAPIYTNDLSVPAPQTASGGTPTGTTGLTDVKRIATILQNLNLDLPLYFRTDIAARDEDLGEVVFPNTITFPAGKFEFTKNYDLYDAKTQLELLLTLYHCRIFQSFGRWYIVQNSNIFDQNVKDDILTSVSSGTVPTGIRESITKQITNQKREVLKTTIFNSTGTSQTALYNQQVLKIAPKNLVPINNDLVREFIQPLAENRREASSTQLNFANYNNNPGFEYGTFGWTITGTNAALSTTETVKQGKNTMRIADSVSTGSFEVICFQNDTTLSNSYPVIGLSQESFLDSIGSVPPSFSFLTDFEDFMGIELNIGYFVEASASKSTVITNQVDLRYRIYFEIDAGSPTYSNSYYDVDNKTWSTSVKTNTKVVKTFNSWQNIKVDLKGLDFIGAPHYETPIGKLKVFILNPNVPTSFTDYEAIYFDNVAFENKRPVIATFDSGPPNGFPANLIINTNGDDVGDLNKSFKEVARRQSSIEVSNIKSQKIPYLYNVRTELTKFFFNSGGSGSTSTGFTIMPQVTGMNFPNPETFYWYRTRDNYNAGAGLTNFYKSLHRISSQIIMNDFRDFVSQYEGSFRETQTRPLALNNRILFDWPNVLSEAQPAIIDKLKYNVKNAEFKVTSHIPNDDDDVSLNFVVTTE